MTTKTPTPPDLEAREFRNWMRLEIVEGAFDFAGLLQTYTESGDTYTEISEDGADRLADYIEDLVQQYEDAHPEVNQLAYDTGVEEERRRIARDLIEFFHGDTGIIEEIGMDAYIEKLSTE